MERLPFRIWKADLMSKRPHARTQGWHYQFDVEELLDARQLGLPVAVEVDTSTRRALQNRMVLHPKIRLVKSNTARHTLQATPREVVARALRSDQVTATSP